MSIPMIGEEIFNYLSENGITIKKVEVGRKYWFVRTDSGKYYDEFIMDDFIAVGWDDIPELKDNSQSEEERVTKLIIAKYPDVAQPKRVINQVNRFCKEMKIGDIVIIPAKGSTVLAFGVIDSNVNIIQSPSEDDILDGACPFTRRRDIKWLKGIPKYRIDPYLYQLFRSHHAVSVADLYAPFIDRVINNFYIKDNKAHFTIGITSETEQRALDLPLFLSGVIEKAKALSEELGVEFDPNDIKMRINVQSPGVSELFGKPVVVALVAIVVVGLFGGTAKFQHTEPSGSKTDIEVGTEGLPHLIDTIYKVEEKYNTVDNPYNRRKLTDVIERGKIKDPRDEHIQGARSLDHNIDNDVD